MPMLRSGRRRGIPEILSPQSTSPSESQSQPAAARPARGSPLWRRRSMAGGGSAGSVKKRALRDRDRLAAADALGDDVVGELGTGGHPELPEGLAQVVLHSARADEQLRGYLSVRVSSAHEGRDLRLLGGELLGSSQLALARMLARGQQFRARPLRETGQAHTVEHVEGGAEVLACLPALPLPAQPLTVDEVCASELGGAPGPAQQV